MLLGTVLAVGAERKGRRPSPPAAVPQGVRVLRDLDYIQNGHERNRLDLYLPTNAVAPLPVIVWVHGGGWTNGDKDKTVPISQSERFAQALNQAGVEATFLVVKGGGHGSPLFTNPESMKHIEDFFRKHLTPPKPLPDPAPSR